MSDKDAWSFQVSLYFGPRIGRKGAWLTGAVKQKTLKIKPCATKRATNRGGSRRDRAGHCRAYMNLFV
ncbi:hypothetical protein TMES_17520 [Thalassospira mesophila]|uniref:Uncharacterized protein n=1 Tax=Thalassospira mesophila TaxID=1293891 RepID=A0A1Y2KWL2_9PROT|nr:hypothetical protein TMES_17520 [Thalassospira mesophila]OSQ41459.1 hypothetical protein THS27_19345 [Thalassospira sp. MCCC 1A01428]